jgi:ABC-type dipeptide/oligopeptide/nickel transport system permease subunit
MTEQAQQLNESSRALERADPLTAQGLHARKGSQGFWALTWRRFRRNRLGMVALFVVILIIGFTLSAGLISEHITGVTPYKNDLPMKLSAPGENGYILGSDGNGRDVLTRLAYGGRASLMIAGLSMITILAIGTILGSVAGYFGGWSETIIMRAVDMLLSIPTLPLLILLASFYRPGPAMLAIFVASVSWAGVSRIIRGEVLRLRHQEFIQAARLLGSSNSRIIFRHIMPNVVPIIVVWASLVIPGLILTEAALSYLGVGVRAPTPSWGNMLQDSKQYIRTSWTLVFIPGFMIYISALSIYLVGSGLRDATDPRLNK